MQSAIPENNFQSEMLSIEQFANKMGVRRTTVYEWLKSGHLVSGRHFIRIGRTTRFPWGPELVQKLFEDSQKTEQPEALSIERPVIKPLLKVPAVGKHRLRVNLDY